MKEFACKKCDRSFSVAGTLFAHYRMHMKLEFACTVCFEEFPSKTIFGVHRDSDESSCKAAKAIVKTSINQQQNDRNSAKKMLSLLDEFKIEVRVRGEMDVFGSECESDRNDDAKAYRANLRERYDLKCPECQLNLLTTSQAIEHFFAAHGIRLYLCPTSNCERVFNRESRLRNHRKEEHHVYVDREQKDHQEYGGPVKAIQQKINDRNSMIIKNEPGLPKYISQAVQAQVLCIDAAVQTDDDFPTFVRENNRKAVTSSTTTASLAADVFVSLCSSDEESELFYPPIKRAC